MRISIAAVMGRGGSAVLGAPLEMYAGRLAGYCPVEFPVYASEEALLEALSRQRARTPALLVMLDSRGKSLASEAFAGLLQRERDAGRQAFVFAIGPASGWSDDARSKADVLLSLGAMTLPHELARVVLTEQVYRAFTIMAGHPYHLGH